MRPQSDWMLLERIIIKSDSGLVLPDTANELKSDESASFRVLAVGPGYYEFGKFITPNVMVGDIVILEGMNIAKFQYGKGKKQYLAAHARNVAFLVDEEDMEGGETDAGNSVGDDTTGPQEDTLNR